MGLTAVLLLLAAAAASDASDAAARGNVVSSAALSCWAFAVVVVTSATMIRGWRRMYLYVSLAAPFGGYAIGEVASAVVHHNASDGRWVAESLILAGLPVGIVAGLRHHRILAALPFGIIAALLLPTSWAVSGEGAIPAAVLGLSLTIALTTTAGAVLAKGMRWQLLAALGSSVFPIASWTLCAIAATRGDGSFAVQAGLLGLYLTIIVPAWAWFGTRTLAYWLVRHFILVTTAYLISLNVFFDLFESSPADLLTGAATAVVAMLLVTLVARLRSGSSPIASGVVVSGICMLTVWLITSIGVVHTQHTLPFLRMNLHNASTVFGFGAAVAFAVNEQRLRLLTRCLCLGVTAAAVAAIAVLSVEPPESALAIIERGSTGALIGVAVAVRFDRNLSQLAAEAVPALERSRPDLGKGRLDPPSLATRPALPPPPRPPRV